MITILSEVLAFEEDLAGYVTYIFRNIESKDTFTEYVMCTKYPNWNCGDIKIGDIGFLTFEEHIAGLDKWFDGREYHYYNYTGIQLIKFIKKQDKPSQQIIL